jgi:hypothetical protein
MLEALLLFSRVSSSHDIELSADRNLLYVTLLYFTYARCSTVFRFWDVGIFEFGPITVLTEVPRNSPQSFSGKWKNTWKETMAEFLRCRFRIVIIIRYFTNFAVKKIDAIET